MIIEMRGQNDGLNDEVSELSALDASEPKLTRQEFRDESDLNILLKKFGAGGLLAHDVQYGQLDYDTDLATAIDSMDRLILTFRKLPQELQDKYRTPGAMIAAHNTGELKDDLQAIEAAKTPTPAATTT